MCLYGFPWAGQDCTCAVPYCRVTVKLKEGVRRVRVLGGPDDHDHCDV